MIYIYKKDKLIDVLNYEIKDFKKEWYPNFQEDMKIYDKKFEYPIYIDNTLREMTREEKLNRNIEVVLDDGEIVQNKKIIKVPKPQGNSKYISWNKEQKIWVLDTEQELFDFISLIDSYKEEILEYGFNYKVENNYHRQRCRNKDITSMVSTIVALQLADKLGIKKSTTWYFEDNFGYKVDLQKLGILMLYGVTFVQSVYDTEHYFKTKVNPKELSKTEFEDKRKEIHTELVKQES